MDFIAHIRKSDGEVQTVNEHLRAVQANCERYGGKIGAKHLAGLAGLLHDVGKNTNGFKTYIELAAANPDAPPRRGSVDHATAGGRLLYRRYHRKAVTYKDKLAAEWIGDCIISHHQGLRDYLDPDATSPFLERVALKTRGMEEYAQAEAVLLESIPSAELDRIFEQAKEEVQNILNLIETNRLPSITASLAIKYIFSCLIDADRTNTREFEENKEPVQELDSQAFFTKCYSRLMDKLDSLDREEGADHPINRLRREMSGQCDAFAMRPSGIYTLSIPTGGGKTLASLRYALQHAKTCGKERIVYIVPYTTIIEQNANDIRAILQEDDMILEHHSNVIDNLDSEEDDYDIRKERLTLARDNWDRPIIFTTMVQFLNTFYAKGTRNTRRLHQLANAVLIFDEVQSVPAKCISLFNAALNFLHVLGGSSIVLCTATQPALDTVKHNLQLPEPAEMIQQLDDVGKSFKRVDIIDRTVAAGWTTEVLASFVQEQMDEINSVLVILNTKTAVRKLFTLLEKSEWTRDGELRLFHLSTNMCAAHRKDVLKELIAALEAEERVICVSTQLIEAGVNISFDCVIRSLAGLDSIAQAAGRCNRHGKDGIRNVYIVKSADEALSRLPEIGIGAEKTERLLNEFRQEPGKFGDDLLSATAMKTYFCYYYDHIKEELDYLIPPLDHKKMFDLLGNNKSYYDYYQHSRGEKPAVLSRSALATAEKYFEVISQHSTSILVPYNDDARNLILSLNGELDTRELGELLREAQQYMVNVYDHDLKKLDASGDIYPLLHGHVTALREVAYSTEFGVEVGGEGEWALAMI